MHVLIIPSGYPHFANRLQGIFYQEQAQAILRSGVNVGIVFPEIISIKRFYYRPNIMIRSRFHTTDNLESGVRTLRYHGWGWWRFYNLFNSKKTLEERWTEVALKLVSKYIKKYGKPDIIHAHCTLWGGVAAMEASKIYGIPYVVTEHSTTFSRGLITESQKPIICRVFERATKLLTVSAELGRRILPYTGGRVTVVLPNLVNTNFFTPPEISNSPPPYIFFNLAFLNPHKGQANLVKAYAQAFPKDENVLLEIGGAGPEETNLRRLARELGVENRVQFLGALTRDKVRSAMQRAHAFVLPSFVETFGVVLIEAMASGLPVVATRCGGPEEFVTDDVGILCPAGDVQAMAEAMASMNRNYEKWASRSDLIRQYAVEKFSERNIAKKLVFIYQEALQEYRLGQGGAETPG